MSEISVGQLIEIVQEWEREKAVVRADYFFSQLESCTVVGKPTFITDKAFGVWSDSASVRVDLSTATNVARAAEGQLKAPTGAKVIQGEEFEDHVWIRLQSGANFLIGKKK